MFPKKRKSKRRSCNFTAMQVTSSIGISTMSKKRFHCSKKSSFSSNMKRSPSAEIHCIHISTMLKEDFGAFDASHKMKCCAALFISRIHLSSFLSCFLHLSFPCLPFFFLFSVFSFFCWQCPFHQHQHDSRLHQF